MELKRGTPPPRIVIPESRHVIDTFPPMTRPASQISAGDAAIYHPRVVDNPADLERWRPYWESVAWHPGTQLDFFSLINKIRNDVLKPYVIVIERDNTPCALVVGRLVKEDFTCHIGYKRFNLGRVRQLNILHGGILGCDDRACAQVVISALDGVLRRREADLVFINHLNIASPLYGLAREYPGILCRDRADMPQPHWKAALPATSEAFLQRLTQKHRYWLRRLERLAEAAYPGKVHCRFLAEGVPLDALMRDMEEVAAKTYQRQLGVGFRNDGEHVERFALESGRGCLHVSVLYLGGKPAAFWVGTLYKGVFFSDYTGYNPEFRKYEPGTLLFMKMVEQLCLAGITEIDFGLGDAQYKQRFGDQNWMDASVRIFAPTLKGILLNVTQLSLQLPETCARSLLRHTRWLGYLKTLWRKRLVQHAEGDRL